MPAIQQLTACPVCRSPDGHGLVSQERDAARVTLDCPNCGKFTVTDSLLAGPLAPSGNVPAVRRAALSHQIRSASDDGRPPLLTTGWYQKFLESDSALPNPAIQAANIIRFIGDQVQKTGHPLPALPTGLAAIAGSLTQTLAVGLARDLLSNGTIKDDGRGTPTAPTFASINLTLQGWGQYDLEKRGKKAGNVGFVAMKFGNASLEGVIRDHIRPAVRDLGYEIVDLRDVSRAGVIDNLLRAQIRDSAFVLADLTDDNYGAYWEAGYAEGLGKPVIYLCEAAKFKEAKTHFDTNHSTTVLWDRDHPDRFIPELIATIRRSLNLFPNS